MRVSEGWIGRALARVEDDRLVSGRGSFVDDVASPGCLHVEFCRSAQARGRLRAVAIERARAAPGVVAILRGEDLALAGAPPVNLLFDGIAVPEFAALARTHVRHVGQPVAAVIAASEVQARDAAELVEIAIDEEAAPPRAPCFARELQDGDIRAAFARAAHVVELEIRHARLAPVALEPRAVLAEWDAARDAMTIRLSTQTPHRARTTLAALLQLDAERLRVVATDVGGAFGGKSSLHPEEVVVAWAARHLRRCVRWRATRGEEMLAASHGRGGVLRGALALDGAGRCLGLRAALDFPLGAWMGFSGAVPARNAARILPGPYRMEAVEVSFRGVPDDTMSVGIYRGAGRPEAAMLLERLMDRAARRIGLDPIELRRRNLVPVAAMPHRLPGGETIDSGDFPALLAAATTNIDRLRADCARRRAAGEICGLGVGLYVEPCGQGWESAAIRLDRGGAIVAATGSTAQGQGRETAARQIVATALGVALDAVTIHHGDTAATPPGIGALASRSTAIGGSALLAAARAFEAKARMRAASRLGVAESALARGTEGFLAASRTVTWSELADDDRSSLSVELRYDAAGEAWASGCCVAVVAIDRETGAVRVERLELVDDPGTIVNPLLVEGQLHGGLAQGLGEALMERIVYAPDGQLLTGSMMDYALPRAIDMPAIHLLTRATPSPANLLGAKGAGEAGCIGAPAAIVNAVVDALTPWGVRHLDMPLTSETIWRAMRGGDAAGRDDER